MTSLNILVVGGGLGGEAVALFLARAGHRVTVVERYSALRAGGTQIDLRDQGVEVARRTGLLDKIREQTIAEAGFAVVDAKNRTKVFWPGAGEDDGTSFFTQEIEIMRGDLVRVLYDATKDSVKYIFGLTVRSYSQDESSVTVAFSDDTKAPYDLLIGADGLGSWTRKSMLAPGASDPIKTLNIWLAYWFIPRAETDTNVARMFYVPGRKVAMLRSTNGHDTQAYFGIRSSELKSLRSAPEAQQKQLWAGLFKNAGWETERMVSSLDSTKDFYCTELAQVKSDSWSKGRVALVGDAANCPSAATGMGTTNAFVGAYVLAGEIASRPDDLQAALREYEVKLRPYVDAVQELPPMVDAFIPETKSGIWFITLLMSLFPYLMKVMVWLRLNKVWEWVSPDKQKAWKLPEYPALQ